MKILIYISTVVFMMGCQTAEKKSSVGLPGLSIETKAQIRDLKNNKTNNVSIDILSVQKAALRLEVTATLGYPVASYVATPRDVKVAVYTQKKYYYGENSPEVLRPMMGIALDPQIFEHIIYDTMIPGWQCETGNDKVVNGCKKTTPRGEFVVAWQERKEGTKRVVIQGPQFEMQWQFRQPKSMAMKGDSFKLEAPEGYQSIPLKKR